MSGTNSRYDEAIELQESGNLDEAVAKLEAIVTDDPDHVLAHAGLGAFYSKLGQHDKAVEHQGKVCELDADDPFSFMAMSLICQKAGKLAEAEEAMGQAMKKQWAQPSDD